MEQRAMKYFTQQHLKTILDYNPEIGEFIWIVKPSCRVNLGAVAGGRCGNGYSSIQINKKAHLAHRLAWLYMTGEWPKDMIDHINRKKDDNRWCNLRECTQSQNYANSGKQKNNKSGYKGVSKEGNRWRADIFFDKTQHYLGCFGTRREAAAAYNSKAIEFHGEFAYQS